MVTSSNSSEPNDQGRSIAKAYIREMLELNPIWESATILRRRRELWTGESASPASHSAVSVATAAAVASSDSQADRRLEERARRCLGILQESFYQLPEKKLNEYIAFLHNKRLPEFAAKAARLKTVAQHRNTLLQVQEKTGDEKFAYSLLHALVCPAANAGSLKEQYIEAIIAERRVKPSCKMVRQFADSHPEIYSMERDWFELFFDKVNQKQWAAQYSLRGRYRSAAGSRMLNLIVIGSFVAAVIIVPLVTTDDSTRRQRSRSRVTTPYGAQKHEEMMKKLRRNSRPSAPLSQPTNSASQSQPGSQYDPATPSSTVLPSFGSDHNFSGIDPATGLPPSPSAAPTFQELMEQSRKQRDQTLRSMKEQFDQFKRGPQEFGAPQPGAPQLMAPGEMNLPSFEPPNFRQPAFRQPNFERPSLPNVSRPSLPPFKPF
jgi:hypothetical protein